MLNKKNILPTEKLSPLASSIALALTLPSLTMVGSVQAASCTYNDGVCEIEVTNSYYSGEGSLSDALDYADESAEGDSLITFSSDLEGESVSLGNIDLSYTYITVDGSGLTDISINLVNESNYDSGINLSGYYSELTIKNIDINVNGNPGQTLTGISVSGRSPTLSLQNVNMTLSSYGESGSVLGIDFNQYGSYYGSEKGLYLDNVTISSEGEGYPSSVAAIKANVQYGAVVSLASTSISDLLNTEGESAVLVNLSRESQLEISDSTFTNNIAYYGNSAAAISVMVNGGYAEGSSISIVDSTFSDNEGESAVAIINRANGTDILEIDIESTTFSENVGGALSVSNDAYYSETALGITGSIFSNNESNSEAEGEGSVTLYNNSRGSDLEVNIESTTFSENEGGALVVSGYARYSETALNVTDSIFSSNEGSNEGEGSVTYLQAGFRSDFYASISNSSFTENYGTSIFSNASGYGSNIDIILDGVTVADNVAYESELEANLAFISWGDRAYSSIEIVNSSISGNTGTGLGMDISSGYVANLLISNSDITNNAAYYSAGIALNVGDKYNNPSLSATVLNSTINGNTTYGYSSGGGLTARASDNNYLELLVLNSTIVNNHAAYGSAIFTNSNSYEGYVTTRIVNSTITGNTSFEDNEFSKPALSFEAEGDVSILNSIASGSSRTFFDESGYTTIDSDLFIGSDINADIQFSLIGVEEGLDEFALNGTNNIIGVDPKLGALADNGGTTLTVCLLEGSPAIDSASQSIINDVNAEAEGSYSLNNDQTDVYRLGDKGPDMGSVEFTENCGAAVPEEEEPKKKKKKSSGSFGGFILASLAGLSLFRRKMFKLR